MKVNPYISNPFSREAEKKMFEDIIYELQEYESDTEIWIVGNVELIDTQLDVLIIKENYLIIIEMKNMAGKVVGSENGDWKVKKEDKEEIECDKNYFQQVQNQRYSLKEKIHNIINQGGLSKFKDDRDVFYKTAAWLCFNEGSTYNNNQIPSKAQNWFKVITTDSIADEITSPTSTGDYLLSKKNIQEILDFLSSEIYILEKDNKNLVKEEDAVKRY